MPFIVRADERVADFLAPGISREWILPPNRLADGRLSVEILSMTTGTRYLVPTSGDELAWLQVLDGETTLDGQPTDRFIVTMLARGASAELSTNADATVLVCRVPHAIDYDRHVHQSAQTDLHRKAPNQKPYPAQKNQIGCSGSP